VYLRVPASLAATRSRARLRAQPHPQSTAPLAAPRGKVERGGGRPGFRLGEEILARAKVERELLRDGLVRLLHGARVPGRRRRESSRGRRGYRACRAARGRLAEGAGRRRAARSGAVRLGRLRALNQAAVPLEHGRESADSRAANNHAARLFRELHSVREEGEEEKQRKCEKGGNGEIGKSVQFRKSGLHFASNAVAHANARALIRVLLALLFQSVALKRSPRALSPPAAPRRPPKPAEDGRRPERRPDAARGNRRAEWRTEERR
jgi:hypothetical protein